MPPEPDSTSTPSRWRDLDRVVVTIAAAALLPLMAAPLNMHWLQWVAYLPMLWVLRADRPRANRWLAYLYGVVGVGLIFQWIVETVVLFSNIPAPLAWLLLLLFAAAFGLPYLLMWSAVHVLRRRLGAGWILAFPAWVVLIEYASMYVILFPYNQGIAQYGMPEVWQLSSVTGVWGVTWLVLFFNCAVGEIIYRRREGRPLPTPWIAAAVTTWAVVVIWGHFRYERIEAALREAPTITVGIIQTDKTMTHRFSESRRHALHDWVRETRALLDVTAPGEVDLVVWSEGASPYNVHEGRVYEIIAALARAGEFDFFVGGGTVERWDEGGVQHIEAYNSVYLFDAAGEVAGRYDKVVPLPFGEYLPLADVFPWLADLIQGPGSFRAGEDTVVLESDVGRIAAPICYEAVLPSLVRQFPAPDLIVNVTNDAWFGTTAAPHQHAMLAAARATELGIPLVRSGYTGVSMVVEPHGRIYGETRPFVRENKVVRVRMATFDTPYKRFGDWFVFLCALALLAAWLIAPWRRGEPNVPPALRDEPEGEAPQT